MSPPAGGLALADERVRVAHAAEELAALVRAGTRLLVVHGNGPQVGRLLAAAGVGDPASLDVHVAQTQGELGYLLAEALERRLAAPCVAVVTRALVDPDDPAFRAPTKPIGPVLAAPPAGLVCARTADGAGYRQVVASPRPLAVLEEAALAALLATHHVIAGGGGGVPLACRDGSRTPVAAVIDKDWVASLLARRLGAGRLVFATDVAHAFEGFGGGAPRALARLGCADARRRLARGEFGPGSMAPKVAAAVEFAEATGRAAVIAAVGGLARALRGEGGTRIEPG